MRVALVSATLGGLFGAVMAVSFTRYSSSAPSTPPVAAESQPATRPVQVPAAWDKRFLTRLSGMESRLDVLEGAAAKAEADRAQAAPDSAEAEHTDPSDTRTQRQSELELQYQRDIDHQAQKVIEHEQERLDASWALGQTAIVTSAFEAAMSKEHPFKLARVSCRSATCVAELAYPSPDEALEDGDALVRARVPGCPGMFSALTPPSGRGEYKRTVIYDCRPTP